MVQILLYYGFLTVNSHFLDFKAAFSGGQTMVYLLPNRTSIFFKSLFHWMVIDLRLCGSWLWSILVGFQGSHLVRAGGGQARPSLASFLALVYPGWLSG
ncbi:hypothetical protein DM01DRAFT_1134713 [Hesseltinella vesiculosa]|uniref:Uncharacterized protein n=1 Tax=Hesseltinella vesiculosa TaxID=101127 RepID=A0A1X2G8U9_9FUNG|nr:hypothetical protein DM01DRAFT_1134713 [Hesseltinella vesiculosa]